MEKSAGKLTGDWDPVNAELSDVVVYLDKFNNMCVAKVMPYEEKQQRCVAETAGLKEALSILSGGALSQQPKPCIEPPSMSVRHWAQTRQQQ